MLIALPARDPSHEEDLGHRSVAPERSRGIPIETPYPCAHRILRRRSLEAARSGRDFRIVPQSVQQYSPVSRKPTSAKHPATAGSCCLRRRLSRFFSRLLINVALCLVRRGFRDDVLSVSCDPPVIVRRRADDRDAQLCRAAAPERLLRTPLGSHGAANPSWRTRGRSSLPQRARRPAGPRSRRASE